MLRPFSWRSASSENQGAHIIHETTAFPIVAVQIEFAPFSRHKILDSVPVRCLQDFSNFFKPPILFVAGGLGENDSVPVLDYPASIILIRFKIPNQVEVVLANFGKLFWRKL